MRSDREDAQDPGGTDAGRDASPEASPSAVPQRHEQGAIGLFSRTWELELLISGALVFALLQAPGHIDGIWDRVRYDLGADAFQAGALAYIYARAIAFVLITAFLLNLGARAYWIALIGMDSVFPQGVRWEKSQGGPIQREVYRRYIPRARVLIERVDNFCSITFSLAAVLALVFVFSIFITAAIGLSVYFIARWFLDGRNVESLTIIVLFAFAAFSIAVGLTDKFYGERLRERRSGRVLARIINALAVISLVPVYGTIMMTLFTNIRPRVIVPIFYTVMFAVIFAVLVDVLGEEAAIAGDKYLPAYAGSVGVDYRYYDNYADGDDALSIVPRLQSDVITGPYVRLFMPYNARHENVAIERLCPGVQPLAGRPLVLDAEDSEPPDSAAAAQVLACIANYRRVALDGVHLAQLPLRFYTEPRSSQEGVVAYIPAASLAPGEHTLTVQRPPRWDSDAEPGAEPEEALPPYVIRFWK